MTTSGTTNDSDWSFLLNSLFSHNMMLVWVSLKLTRWLCASTALLSNDSYFKHYFVIVPLLPALSNFRFEKKYLHIYSEDAYSLSMSENRYCSCSGLIKNENSLLMIREPLTLLTPCYAKPLSKVHLSTKSSWAGNETPTLHPPPPFPHKKKKKREKKRKEYI